MAFGSHHSLSLVSRLAWLVAACVVLTAGEARATASDELRVAKNNYEYGDFAKTVAILSALPDMAVLPLESERIEAYRLLGLAEFFLGHRLQAENAFFDLLKQNPDLTLDPFYVPPDAVAFFDDVKRRNEEYLAPIRDRRRARVREQQAEEAARKEAERRRGETQKQLAAPTLVSERIVRENSRTLAWLPFGLGQFQNGSETAGRVLAVTEVATALTSVVMYGIIWGLRGADGKFHGDDFARANTMQAIQYVSGGLFYALWLGGAVEANLRFEPTTLLGESTRVPGAPPVVSPIPGGVPAPGVTSPPPAAPTPVLPSTPKTLPIPGDSIRDAIPPADLPTRPTVPRTESLTPDAPAETQVQARATEGT